MCDNEDVEFMDTSDTTWSWYYLADCGRWHQFEDDPDNTLSSDHIESYYLKNSKGVLNTSSTTSRIKIDFSAMLETDLSTGRQRRIHRGYNIQRSCSCFTIAPVFWDMVDLTRPYQLISLSELTPEYKTVAAYVKDDGLLDKPIESISRIQNLDLWEMYCRKKKQLMRIQGVKEIQERRLFHGTDSSNVESICKYNFDVRLAGRHGHTYGKGVYFAKYATYADRYSRSNMQSGHTKIVFLARVIIGKSTVGQSHFRKPDHGSSDNKHNSCVDDDRCPHIFVIFDSNQIYPEYLIHYR
ncbi:protein mono-ADP-ribosyltransferase PARP11 [Mastacembelus armatus]|uniref:Poly [ADP-ribose] polymerase n=1 Tax=Mastacembelus armatus TaxID=205130 RepID=A0A3Q3LR59_9TELE|nr:protein mono-ADP-ribosyltransferase PARP11-like [Mastacembelus armatus]